ncbi:MAG: hypothetical protein V1800_07605 [Candidatus Latescibacterota bacterium]
MFYSEKRKERKQQRKEWTQQGKEKFVVFSHPVQGYEAVKEGFSYPGFLFTFVWALYKKLWGDAAITIIAMWFAWADENNPLIGPPIMSLVTDLFGTLGESACCPKFKEAWF